MLNKKIADIFYDIANILEIKNENVFRIRAYRKAALNIENLAEDIPELINKNTLTGIPGVGKDLADSIIEITSSGKLKLYEQLKKSIPKGILELLKIPGIGPKTAYLLHKKLKIDSQESLEKAIKQGKLTKIARIKDKTIENISRGIKILKAGLMRINLAKAQEIADYFIKNLQATNTISIITAAGSLRRQKETVRDIDILAVSRDSKKIIEEFTLSDETKVIQSKGETKSSILTSNNIQVDLRVLKDENFGAGLIYFTGSQDFNVKLRQIAIKKNLKLNEYGVFNEKNKLIAGKTEEEVFKALGLSFIPPEMRENTGEIELAAKNTLPRLVNLADIKGDLHTHSKYSDGKDTILTMAEKCKNLGYQYIAITDHSESLKVAGGLDIQALRKKKNEIMKLNKKLTNFRILFGAEVEINSNGKIDYSQDILKDFDIVIAAIHSGFRQNKEKITARIISACKNKFVNIIAHPTGKLWGVREPYEINFEEILKAAFDTNTALEIDCFPDRIDLDGAHAKLAKTNGVKIAVNSDSHAVEHLEFMKFGVSTARRGWLEKNDILNTLELKQLLKTIKK